MSDPDYAFEVPLTARFHGRAVDQIIESVEEGIYCALLGPRLCGKTVLLRFVHQKLAGELGWLCIYTDLREIQAATLLDFFAGLCQTTALHIQELTGLEVTPPPAEEASSSAFRAYLMDVLTAVEGDLVLILDNLDAVPMDLVQALLTSLRAAYMDQQTRDHQLTVVVSGALSLATLTVGESSPFRGIARRVFIGDLSREQSRDLIAEYLAAEAVGFTRHAHDRLLEATSGDAYLIRKLCQRSVEAVQSSPHPRLGARNVRQVIRAFLRSEVYHYAPLLEAIRLIEEDPDLLRGILSLLENPSLPRASLPIPLSPDLDPLYLTGVVEAAEGDVYRLQNTIYRRFLAEHFGPGRVGHMLAMAGLWEEAINYLEVGVRNEDSRARTELLTATIQGMFAAKDLGEAAHFLARGILACFGAVQIEIWHAEPGKNVLRLIGNAGAGADPSRWSQPEIDLRADRLAARAFRQAVVLRGGERQGVVQRAIPLAAPGRGPLGVVVLHNPVDAGQVHEQRERDLQLLGYLRQGSRALQAVSTRRQELALAGRIQASLLPEAPPRIPGWQISAVWRPARETSGDFYDFIEFSDGRLGIVIGDVTDKGMGAALYMALSRTLLRTYAAEHDTDAAYAVRAANQRILADTHGGLFIPLFYGILNPTTGRLTYCNAGHHPPYHLARRPDDSPGALSRTGIPLGVTGEAHWGTMTVNLDPGDILVLYTDGIVDAHDREQEMFGAARMLEIAGTLRHRSPRHIQEAVISAVRAHTGAERQFDDLTLVLIKRDVP